MVWVPVALMPLMLALAVLTVEGVRTVTVCTSFRNTCTKAGYNLAIATQKGDSHVSEGWWILPASKTTEVCWDVEDWASKSVSFYLTHIDSPYYNKESHWIPPNPEPWGGSNWAQGEYCIKANTEFKYESAQDMSCDGEGQQRVTFYRVKAASTFVIDSCSVCSKVVNKCADTLYFALAFQSPEAAKGMRIERGWWKVDGHGEEVVCHMAHPGDGETQVGMHFEYPDTPSYESVLTPQKTINFNHLGSPEAVFCVKDDPTQGFAGTSYDCNKQGERSAVFWNIAPPWPLIIDSCRGGSSNAGTDHKSAPAPQPIWVPAPAVSDQYWVKHLPTRAGTNCARVAGTYSLVNRRRTGVNNNCGWHSSVTVHANCAVTIQSASAGTPLWQDVFYIPGSDNIWRGEFMFLRRDSQQRVEDAWSWSDLPRAVITCVVDGRPVGDSIYTIQGW